MRIIIQRPRATNPIASGKQLISVAIASYGLMQFVFFGVPRFTLGTPMGKAEIGYALSYLGLIGIGLHSIWLGMKARRK